MLNESALTESMITTNGIRLHVMQAGPQDGPLVVLLHGFPEFWWGWKYQIEPLALAGFRVAVPDQRGYNLSDKPQGLDAYRLNRLVEDVTGLIHALGYERASVVGHDWGAAVAWSLAALHPEMVEHLAILNVPYPAVAFRGAFRHPDQFLRSAYIAFFQIPLIPEAILRNNNWELMVRTLQRTSRPGTFSEADFEHYRSAWWRKGAMTAMLNWYRAFIRRPPQIPDRPVIQVPTLVLWGKKDFALNPHLARASIDLCPQGQLVYFDEASHWLQHEEPAAVNARLLDFLRS